MAIATAAKQIIADGMQVAVGGGLESISLVQNDKMNRHRTRDPWLTEHVPQLYMAMLETAEIVAERYGISREAQDEYALRSQQRTAAAQAAAGSTRDRPHAERMGCRQGRPARSRTRTMTLTRTRATAPRPRWPASPG